MQTMLSAFHGSQSLKLITIETLKTQIANFKSQNEQPYESLSNCLNAQENLGIPAELLRIISAISHQVKEELPNFLIDCFSAMPAGSELSEVTRHFLAWLIESETYGLLGKVEGDTRVALEKIADCFSTRCCAVGYVETMTLADCAETEKRAACWAAYTIARTAAALASPCTARDRSAVAHSTYFIVDACSWSNQAGIPMYEQGRKLLELIQIHGAA